MSEVNTHIISILMENESGALSRVAGLFSARGYNIESLTVAVTDDETLSRMTLVTKATDEVIEQITKQLNKLVDVVKLLELSKLPHIERGLLLLKVKASKEQQRQEYKRLADIFGAAIVDVTPNTYVMEVSGDMAKLDGFVKAFPHNDIIETVRSGPSGIARGEVSLHL